MNVFKLRYGALLLAALLTDWAAVGPAQSAAHVSAPAATPHAAAGASQNATPENADAHESAASAASADTEAPEEADRQERHTRIHGHHEHGNDFVGIGHDTDLPAGLSADSVVAILGSASSEGEARDVVAVLGNARVTGPVSEDAVAVLGDTYIDSSIAGDAVTVLGNIELGPHADIGGDVVAVGGKVQRDPAAIVRGSVHNIDAFFGGFGWLHAWIKDCLLYGRPLALQSEVGWAWGVALGFLALYALLALLFRGGITRCARTIETQPGPTVLAALLSVLFTPILLILLCITVIGIPAVPLVVFGLFCAGLFGKAVLLAWLGRRCVGERATGLLGEPVVAVLIGGAIVLALYVVPVLGMLVYQILSLLGLGVVVLTLIQSAGLRKGPRVDGPASAAPAGAYAGASAGAAPDATPGPTPAAASLDAGAAPQPARPAGGGSATPAVSAALPRAGFWIRMVALLLDAVLIGILMHLLGHASHWHLIVLAAYGAIMWKLRGATIGGILFDLQVVRLDGRDMDWPTAVVRALSCFLSLVVAGLGFLWIAFDGDKQGWHDKIAGTVVVRAPKGRSVV
ncbi:MAG: RDD family protein [Steroidobacteraceae bacterium]